MRKYGSYIAANIDREYRMRKQYKKRHKLVNCKEKERINVVFNIYVRIKNEI